MKLNLVNEQASMYRLLKCRCPPPEGLAAIVHLGHRHQVPRVAELCRPVLDVEQSISALAIGYPERRDWVAELGVMLLRLWCPDKLRSCCSMQCQCQGVLLLPGQHPPKCISAAHSPAASLVGLETLPCSAPTVSARLFGPWGVLLPKKTIYIHIHICEACSVRLAG